MVDENPTNTGEQGKDTSFSVPNIQEDSDQVSADIGEGTSTSDPKTSDDKDTDQKEAIPVVPSDGSAAETIDTDAIENGLFYTKTELKV